MDIEISVADVLEKGRRLLVNAHREDLAGYISKAIELDGKWMHDNDPAVEEKEEVLLRATTIAVAYYRIANAFYYGIGTIDAKRTARTLWKECTVTTKIDIHPGAKIGVPFGIDHGVGTVIGGTTEIGTHCQLLNNVTLGALEVGEKAGATLRGKKRHPTIGDEVNIAGNVRILGSVHIGHGSKIGARVVITRDIQPYSTVSCISQLQIIRINGETVNPPPVLTQVFPRQIDRWADEKIYLFGCSFEKTTEVEVIRINKNRKEELIRPAMYEHRSDNAITIRIDKDEMKKGYYDVKVVNPDEQSFTLTGCLYVND